MKKIQYFVFYFTFKIVTAFLDPQLNNLLGVVKGKKISILTNPTGVDLDLRMLTDSIEQSCISQNCSIIKFFSPEHGLRSDQQAGEQVKDYVDPLTGIPVISLYGTKKAPSQEDLIDVDDIIFFIQDVGTRFYTYIWTLSYVMESAAVNQKRVVVIDRPLPIGGVKVEGCPNQMDAGLVGRLFKGQQFGLPQRYGMTVGEVAQLINNEWLDQKCDLYIIKMESYKRDQKYPFNWILPSPNMPTIDTALVYPGFGIFEGTNLSEGRGTTRPFEIIGAPFIMQPEILVNTLNNLGLKGVQFRAVYFTPTFSKYVNILCKGVQVHVQDPQQFEPVLSGFSVLKTIIDMYPQDVVFNSMANLLFGSYNFEVYIRNLTPEQILNTCKFNFGRFLALREKYLFY